MFLMLGTKIVLIIQLVGNWIDEEEGKEEASQINVSFRSLVSCKWWRSFFNTILLETMTRRGRDKSSGPTNHEDIRSTLLVSVILAFLILFATVANNISCFFLFFFHSSLERELANLKDANKTEIDKTKLTIDQLKETMKGQESELAKLTREKSGLEQDLAAANMLRKEKDATEKLLKETEAKLKAMTREKDIETNKLMADFKEQEKKIRAQLETEREKISNLETQLSEIDRLKSENKELQTKLNQMAQKLHEAEMNAEKAEKKASKMDSLQKENDEAAITLAKIKGELEKKSEECDKLLKEISTNKDHQSALLGQKDELSKELDILQKSKQAIEKEMNQWTSTKEGLESKIAELEKDVDVAQGKLSDLPKLKDELEKVQGDLKAMVTTLDESKAKQEEAIKISEEKEKEKNELASEILILKKDLETAQANFVDPEILQGHEAALKAKEIKIEELKKEIELKTESQKELLDCKAVLEQNMGQLEKSRNDLSQELQELSKAKEEMSARIAGHEMALKSAEAKILELSSQQDKVAAAESEARNLKRQVQELEQGRQELTSKLEAIEGELKESDEGHSDRIDYKLYLEEQLVQTAEELEATKERSSKAAAAFDLLNSDKETLETALEKSKVHLESTLAQRADMEKELLELKGKDEELSKMKEQLQLSEASVSSLTEKVDQLESLKTELESKIVDAEKLALREKNMRSEISDLEFKLKEGSGQLGNVSNQMREVESKVIQLEAENETLKQTEVELSCRINTLTSEKENLDLQCSQSTAKVSEYHAQLKLAELEITKLKDSCQEHETQIRATEEQTQVRTLSLETMIETLKEAVESEKRQKEVLEAKLRQLQERMSTEQYKQLMKTLEVVDKEFEQEQMSAKIKSITKELLKAKTEFESRNLHLEVALKSAQAKIEEIPALESNLKDAFARIQSYEATLDQSKEVSRQEIEALKQKKNEALEEKKHFETEIKTLREQLSQMASNNQYNELMNTLAATDKDMEKEKLNHQLKGLVADYNNLKGSLEAKNLKLESALAKAMHQLSEVPEMNAKLSEALREIETHKRIQVQMNERLETKIIDFQKEEKASNELKTSLENELVILKQKLLEKDSSAEYQNLMRTLEASDKDLELERLSSEFKKMGSKYEQLKTYHSTKESELADALEAAKAEMAQLSGSHVSESTAPNLELQKVIRELQTEKDRSAFEKAELENEMESMRNLLAEKASTEQYNLLMNALELSDMKLANELASSELEKMVTRYNSFRMSSEDQINDLKVALTRAQADLADVPEVKSSLNKALEDLEAQGQATKLFQAKLETLQKERDEVLQMKEIMESEIDTLRKQIEENDSTKKLSSLADELATAKEALTNRNLEITELQTRSFNLTTALHKAQEDLEELPALRNSLSEALENIDSNEKLKNELTEKICLLQTERDSLVKDKASVEAEMKATKALVEERVASDHLVQQLETSSEELKKKSEELTQLKGHSENKISNLEAALEKAQAQLAEIPALKENLGAACKQIEEQDANASETAARHEEELQGIKSLNTQRLDTLLESEKSLKSQLTSLQDQEIQLEATIQGLETELKETKAASDKKIELLQTDLAEQKSIASALQIKLDSLVAQRDQSEDNLTEFRETEKSLREEIESARKELEIWQETSHEKTKELEASRKEFDALVSAKENLEESNGAVADELKERIKDMESKHSDNQEKLNEYQEYIDELEKMQEESVEKTNELENQISAYSKQIHELRSSMTDLSKENSERQSQLESLTKLHETEKSKLASANDDLTAQLALKEEERNKLSNDLSKLESALAEAKDKLDQKNEETDAEVEKLAMDKCDLEEKIETLVEDLSNKAEEIEKLKLRMSDSETDWAAKLSALSGEKDQLDQKLERVEKELEKASAELADGDKMKNEMKQMANKVLDLEDKIVELEDDIKEKENLLEQERNNSVLDDFKKYVPFKILIYHCHYLG